MGRADGPLARAAVLGLLVATAGCLGFGGTPTPTPTPAAGSTPTATATPTEAGSTPTATVTATPLQYPPGLDAEGYVNRESFVDGHLDQLAGTSFTSVTRLKYEERTVTIRIEGDPQREHVTKVRTGDGDVTGKFFYGEGTVEVAQGFQGGSMTYREAISFDGQFETLFWSTLSDPERSVRDGRTVFTYQVSGRANGTVTATSDGVIRSYTLEQDDGPTIHYEVSGLGTTTVEEPPWAN
jgi:hypothetical protein